MSFSPTIVHDSKAVPGVRFTVHRMGFGRRTDLDFQTLNLRQRLRELEIDNPPDTPREKELQEQIAIARKKALLVPPEEIDAVISADIVPLMADLAAAADPETKKRRAVLNEEYITVESRIRERWIRAGLVSIEGGEFGGMSADELLQFGPAELAAEIYQAIASGGKLSGAETKNSSSPTISGAPVGGEKTSTDAPNAEPLLSATT
jgi:hypothetical protein